MDPALQKLLEGDGDDEVQAIIRLDPSAAPPPGVRIVTRFGDVATCRLKRALIPAVHDSEQVVSMKAPRLISPEPTLYYRDFDDSDLSEAYNDQRRPAGLKATGKGVVVGILDWGCDFAHRDFRSAGGYSRLISLWDQGAKKGPHSPGIFGYGRHYGFAEINNALRTNEPYKALGYHPGNSDPQGGSHGTHVMSIAAGGGASGPAGMAPGADLVFVHLSTPAPKQGTGGNLGDTVALLEAVDYVNRVANGRPTVMNLSAGRHWGPHDGSTPVERGFENFVKSGPGKCIVQSCGNYYDRRIHSSGRVEPGRVSVVGWVVDAADTTDNEIEVWYPGGDRFVLQLESPDGAVKYRLKVGTDAPIVIGGKTFGHIYHRLRDPNNLKNHIDCFLNVGAPIGTWQIKLYGDDVADGRYHMWVERDDCTRCQSRVDPTSVDPQYTTGTVCNGFHTIAVGAYNPHSGKRELPIFSSSGPTVDGRQKPDCLAPGVDILAAKSSPRSLSAPVSGYMRLSGTSMAAPYATGLVACLYEAAKRPLEIRELRSALLGTADRPPRNLPPARVGSGYLNPVKAVADVTPRPAKESVSAGLWQNAAVFDALVYGVRPALRQQLEHVVEVVGLPGQVPSSTVRGGDILVRRALGEGFVARASVLRPAGAGAEAAAGHPEARLGWDELIVRPVRESPGEPPGVRPANFIPEPCGCKGSVETENNFLLPCDCEHGTAEATPSTVDSVTHVCRPGEGPPAPEPDPQGKGPHPLIKKGISSANSRRPSAGFAQQCLNNYLDQQVKGSVSCRSETAQTRQFIEACLATLRRNSQLPLVVDCRFGENSELATKAFQACMAIDRDGKIGPITWPLLEQFAAGTAATPRITAVSNLVLVTRPANPAAQVSVRLAVDGSFTGTGTLTVVSASPTLTIKLLRAGVALQFDGRDNVFSAADLQAGVGLTAEAVAPSPAVDDFQMILTLSGLGTPNMARTTLTAVALTLDICLSRLGPVAPPVMSSADKVNIGRFVQVRDPGQSHERAMVIVRPPAPAGIQASVELVQSPPPGGAASGLQVFDVEDPSLPIASKLLPLGIPIASIPAGGLNLFVESGSPSTAPRDMFLGVRLSGRDLVADTVRITSVQLSAAKTDQPAAPPVRFAQFGLWDQAYDAAGNIRNGAAEDANFIGRDTRRLHIRVIDAAAAGPVQLNWRTLKADRSDDDAPPSQVLTLPRAAGGRGQFISRGVMLVTDDTDRDTPTDSGLAAPLDAGARTRGQSNHRIRRAGIDGLIRAEYVPSPGVRLTLTLPVFDRLDDKRRRVPVRVIRYTNGGPLFVNAAAAGIAAQFTHANRRWNQVGIQIAGGNTVDRSIPAAALNAAGVYPGGINSPQEQAALADLIPITPDNTVTVVFTSLSGANAYTTLFERAQIALPDGNVLSLGNRYFVFVNAVLSENDETLAHEFHHVLFNRHDGAAGRAFFTFNTSPPTSFGLPLPDARIYRRIQNQHTANPDEDPQNDNVVNWARRARAARFPIAGDLNPAAGATTGNTLTVGF